MSLKMLVEKFARDQIFIQNDFSSVNMIYSFFAIFAFWYTDPTVDPTWHFCYDG